MRHLPASGLASYLTFLLLSVPCSAELSLTIEQITHGPKHHFFGYIGQSRTIPWNGDGRYILALRTDFHDHMPKPQEAAEIILLDTRNNYEAVPIEETRAWNFQQGTMFYWNPEAPDTQFFFNDRDPKTGKVFTVLYDIEKRQRVHEYRFEDTPFGNSGVAQGGGKFLGINYGRMDRLREVTGYPDAFDWTGDERAPANDGVFIVDVDSGEKKLLVSFADLLEAVKPLKPDAEKASLYINHTLWNRNSDRIYFFLRGRFEDQAMWVNVPCTIHPDGTGLTAHETFIGGHPEWAEGNLVIGREGSRQILYDVDSQEIVEQWGTEKIFPKPEGDISLSPDGRLFANGYQAPSGENVYVVFDRKTGEHVRSAGLSRGPYRDELRIDPAPCWNRSGDALLVPGWTESGSRQIYLIQVKGMDR